MLRSKLSILVFLYTLSLATDSVASIGATTRLWSMVGSGCVPDSGTLASGQLGNTAVYGYLYFANTLPGTLRFTCPIQNAYPSAITGTPTLDITYLDGDGTRGNCRVQVYVFRTSTNSSGAGAQLAYIDSNFYSSTTRTEVSHQLSASVMDFENYYYWVYVQMDQIDNPGCTTQFFGVSIKNS